MPDEENKTIPVEESAPKSWLYRHRTVRRYKVDSFEFLNFTLRINDAKENERFVKILHELPRIETTDIMLVNEVSEASTESRVVRDAMSAGDILTAKDRENIASQQSGSAQPTGVNALFGKK